MSARNSCFGNLLRGCSFGQYTTKLYYKGNDKHSSKIGGILSLICGIAFLLSAIYILWETIFSKLPNKSMTEEIRIMYTSQFYSPNAFTSDCDLVTVQNNLGILYYPMQESIQIKG